MTRHSTGRRVVECRACGRYFNIIVNGHTCPFCGTEQGGRDD